MKVIEIENEVYEALARHVRGFNESPNDVLKRLLREVSEGHLSLDHLPNVASVSEPEATSSRHGREKPEAESISDEAETFPTETNLQQLVRSAEFKQLDSLERYLWVLKCLHDYSPATFEKLSSYRPGGVGDVHFCRSIEEIEDNPNGPETKRLFGTPYCVLTNLSNRSKRKILGDILPGFGFASKEILNVLQTLADPEPVPTKAPV